MSSLRDLRGVGAELERRFLSAGLQSVLDLALLRPRDYRDWRAPQAIASLGATAAARVMAGDDSTREAIVIGTVVSVNQRQGKFSIVRAVIEDESGRCDAVWFARGYRSRVTLDVGMRIFLHGRIKLARFGRAQRLELSVLAFRELSPDKPYVGRIWPIYPATKDLPSRVIARVIESNLPLLLDALPPDPLTPDILARHHLIDRRSAWSELHRPTALEVLAQARERVLFDTFFEIAFSALHRKYMHKRSGHALSLRAPQGLLERFEAELPFTLTTAQRRVIREIWAELATDAPMNRLLQGDVGSGKTLVAAAVIVLAAQAGAQSALMAPTELLARQHARKLAPLLAPFGIGVEYISGTQSARPRREAEERLAGGAIAVAVGTHALLTERVTFARLGVAVIDEQHRFGVLQRAKLRAKGEAVHTLAMTATPIPRTLAQTRYADLDFSVLDELPPGRTPVKTLIRDETAKPKIYEYIRTKVQEGRQAYIVAPVIDEGESALAGALAEAEVLRERVFPDLRVGLVHGRMPARDRDAEMERFSHGDIDILIATTVVEVGVDVPNASIMVVLDAHRFGLAQLHQLRGRVGRGSAAATCVLIAPRKTRRLAVLTETTDGFIIADADLELRGEGEFAGTEQSGTGSPFRIAGQDEMMLYQAARAEAEAIFQRDPELTAPSHQLLKHILAANVQELAVRVTS